MPEIVLSPEAAADRAWLVDKLGRRYRGIKPLDEDAFFVTILKPDGRHVWFFGSSAATALTRARTYVETTTESTQGEQP